MLFATIARAVVVELVPAASDLHCEDSRACRSGGRPRSVARCPSASASRATRSRLRSRSARTPRSSEPPVTPVAATKMSSPETRSSAERTRSRSKPPSTQRRPLAVVARPQPALDRAAHALDRRGRDDAFGRASDAHQHVDAGRRLAGRDRRGDVPVADQVDAGAGLAQLGDEGVVALALEHDDGEVADAHASSPPPPPARSRSASG